MNLLPLAMLAEQAGGAASTGTRKTVELCSSRATSAHAISCGQYERCAASRIFYSGKKRVTIRKNKALV